MVEEVSVVCGGVVWRETARPSGCGDMGFSAAAAALREWAGTGHARTSSIMNKRENSKDKERQSDDKRTST